MRTGFVTCVKLGLECLESIYSCGGQVDLLITVKDELSPHKSGRVYVDDFAQRHDIPVAKVRNINDSDCLSVIEAADLDWLFIVGWSQIAGPGVLNIPRHGVIGMHPTLLPLGRGRASIPWAILTGLTHTGVTLFKLDEGVDTGPIMAQRTIDIAPVDTATTLYRKVCEAHSALIRDTWSPIVEGAITFSPQDETRATTWPGRTPADGRIDLDQHSVTQVDRLVRATTHPYPGAFIEWPDGTTMRIWEGSTSVPASSPSGYFAVSATDGNYYVTRWAEELEA